jgi:hypothetical protein
VLSVDEDFWWEHPDLWLDVSYLVDALDSTMCELSGAIERFRAITGG